MIRAETQKQKDGYSLTAHISAAALTGFDPLEHPRLGFTYCIVDREIGLRTFNCGPEFPFRDDPSVWATLELVKEDPGSLAKQAKIKACGQAMISRYRCPPRDSV